MGSKIRWQAMDGLAGENYTCAAAAVGPDSLQRNDMIVCDKPGVDGVHENAPVTFAGHTSFNFKPQGSVTIKHPGKPIPDTDSPYMVEGIWSVSSISRFLSGYITMVLSTADWQLVQLTQPLIISVHASQMARPASSPWRPRRITSLWRLFCEADFSDRGVSSRCYTARTPDPALPYWSRLPPRGQASIIRAMLRPSNAIHIASIC